jgi:transposase
MSPVVLIGKVVEVASWQARVEAAEARAAAAEARVGELSEQVAVLSRMLFGRSSEKTRRRRS